MNTEQLNIEGKRSGSGMVAHKATLANALSRALAERVVLKDFTIGRKGFIAYLKSLGGNDIIKVVHSRSPGKLEFSSPPPQQVRGMLRGDKV